MRRFTEYASDLLEDVHRARAAGANDMRQTDPRAIDLAAARLAAQMRRHFVDVGDAGRAEGMTLGEKPARDVDRDAPPELRLAGIDHPSRFAVLAEAEILVVHEFGGREAVMQLDEVEIVRTKSRHLVSRLRREPRHRVEVHHG